MSFQEFWTRYGKCASGAAGGLGLGMLTGATVGSAIPFLGTFGCGVLGGVSGFLAGSAGSCGDKK